MISKKVLIIAGPNGAGKTTTAQELILDSPSLYEFINADEIARGLGPKHPEKVALTASKLMIQRLKDLLDEKKSFAFETTLAGKNYEKHLQLAKSKGYEIILLFLWLASPMQATKRVTQRVKQGGHFVPKEVIVRRYHAGLNNLLTSYLPIADTAIVMNNSTEEPKAKQSNLVARKNSGEVLNVFDQNVWEKMKEAVNGR